jgi:hypothetical protein
MNTNDNNDLIVPMPSDADLGIGDEDAGNLDIGADDHDDEMRNSIDDMSDDAEALAAAGWGTDEDYGGTDPREDWDNPVEVDYDRE